MHLDLSRHLELNFNFRTTTFMYFSFYYTTQSIIYTHHYISCTITSTYWQMYIDPIGVNVLWLNYSKTQLFSLSELHAYILWLKCQHYAMLNEFTLILSKFCTWQVYKSVNITKCIQNKLNDYKNFVFFFFSFFAPFSVVSKPAINFLSNHVKVRWTYFFKYLTLWNIILTKWAGHKFNPFNTSGAGFGSL